MWMYEPDNSVLPDGPPELAGLAGTAGLQARLTELQQQLELERTGRGRSAAQADRLREQLRLAEQDADCAR